MACRKYAGDDAVIPRPRPQSWLRAGLLAALQSGAIARVGGSIASPESLMETLEIFSTANNPTRR
jgi:hypothetical protein